MDGTYGHMWLESYAGTQIKQVVSTKSYYSIFYYFLKDPKYPLGAESEKDDCVSTKYVFHRLLWVAPVVICG